MHVLGQSNHVQVLLVVITILVIYIYICKLTGIPLMP